MVLFLGPSSVKKSAELVYCLGEMSSEGDLVSARGPAVPGTDKLRASAVASVSIGVSRRAVYAGSERAWFCVVSQSGRGESLRVWSHVQAGVAERSGDAAKGGVC